MAEHTKERAAFVAYYEDADKVEAAAKARGFTGNDGESWHDFVESELEKFRTSANFRTLHAAEIWLKAELTATKSVYGAGTILMREPVASRCEACVCEGVRTVREYSVDETGIVEDLAIDPLCVEG